MYRVLSGFGLKYAIALARFSPARLWASWCVIGISFFFRMYVMFLMPFLRYASRSGGVSLMSCVWGFCSLRAISIRANGWFSLYLVWPMRIFWIPSVMYRIWSMVSVCHIWCCSFSF